MSIQGVLQGAGNLLRLLGIDKKNTSSANEPCINNTVKKDIIHSFGIAIGILITVILSFFLRRKSFHREKCNGKPGLAIPFNGLDMRHIRVGYLLGYGALSSTIYDIIQREIPFYKPTFPTWSKKFFQVAAVGIYGTLWYPVFAAVSAELILGYVMALLYLIAFLACTLYNDIACRNRFTQPQHVAIIAFSEFQDYLFKILLIIFFVVVIFKRCRGTEKPSILAKEEEKKGMQEYVRQAFKHKFDDGKLKKKLMKSMQLKQTIGFKYPPRFLCSLLTSATVMYMLLISLSTQIFVFMDRFVSYWNEVAARTNLPIEAIITSATNLSPDNIVKVSAYILSVIRICFIVSMVLAIVLGVSSFPFILRNFKRDVLLAFKGQYTYILPPSHFSPGSALGGFTTLVAYQVAYLCWGFIIHFAFISIITITIGIGFFGLVLNGYGYLYLNLLRKHWLLLLVGILIKISSRLLIRFVFLMPPRNLIAVDNRQVFFIWSYYMFFYNVFIGAFSCLLRIVKSGLIGLFYVGRVDICVLPPNFESMDPGFSAYCGFVLTEVAHSNPIMRTFLNILMDKIEAKRVSSWRGSHRFLPTDSENVVNSMSGFEDNGEKTDLSLRSKQIQFRWFLMYTLHCNPALRPMRKHNLEKFQERMDKLKERSQDEKIKAIQEKKLLKEKNKRAKRKVGTEKADDSVITIL